MRHFRVTLAIATAVLAGGGLEPNWLLQRGPIRLPRPKSAVRWD
jgi:hypothetical protein